MTVVGGAGCGEVGWGQGAVRLGGGRVGSALG